MSTITEAFIERLLQDAPAPTGEFEFNVEEATNDPGEPPILGLDQGDTLRLEPNLYLEGGEDGKDPVVKFLLFKGNEKKATFRRVRVRRHVVQFIGRFHLGGHADHPIRMVIYPAPGGASPPKFRMFGIVMDDKVPGETGPIHGGGGHWHGDN